jgi:S1-C subfamily serine protease
MIDRPARLTPLPLGDGDALRKGQFVVALANPFAAGFRDGSPSVSAGIVSNLRRRLARLPGESDRRRLCLHQFATLITTDARLNVGCSGGALINLKGEVIGLTTAYAALLGVETPGGFALPMTKGVRRIIDVLREGKEVEYGFLGVQFSRNGSRGALVEHVIKQSPADHARLREGDTLVSIAGMPVRDFDDVFVAVGTMLAGNEVIVERVRPGGGRPEAVAVILGKYDVLQPFIASNRQRPVAGLLVDSTCLVVQRVRQEFPEVPEGVLIREVEAGSPAERARLQPDRIISRVNGRKVTNPAEFYRAFQDARGEVELTLLKSFRGTEKVTLKLD